MTDRVDLFISEIKSHEAFPELLEKLIKERPVVPGFDCVHDNTERWKTMSGMAQGYDLCLSIMKFKPEEQL